MIEYRCTSNYSKYRYFWYLVRTVFAEVMRFNELFKESLYQSAITIDYLKKACTKKLLHLTFRNT